MDLLAQVVPLELNVTARASLSSSITVWMFLVTPSATPYKPNRTWLGRGTSIQGADGQASHLDSPAPLARPSHYCKGSAIIAIIAIE